MFMHRMPASDACMDGHQLSQLWVFTVEEAPAVCPLLQCGLSTQCCRQHNTEMTTATPRWPRPPQGYVVFLCGSTGIAGDSLRYVRLLAGMGYLVIAPDDLAGTSHLRRRRARLIIRPDEATDYWERNLLYEDDGAEVGGEM